MSQEWEYQWKFSCDNDKQYEILKSCILDVQQSLPARTSDLDIVTPDRMCDNVWDKSLWVALTKSSWMGRQPHMKPAQEPLQRSQKFRWRNLFRLVSLVPPKTEYTSQSFCLVLLFYSHFSVFRWIISAQWATEFAQCQSSPTIMAEATPGTLRRRDTTTEGTKQF